MGFNVPFHCSLMVSGRKHSERESEDLSEDYTRCVEDAAITVLYLPMALFCLHSQTFLSIIETLASYTVSLQHVLLHFKGNASEYLKRCACAG